MSLYLLYVVVVILFIIFSPISLPPSKCPESINPGGRLNRENTVTNSKVYVSWVPCALPKEQSSHMCLCFDFEIFDRCECSSYCKACHFTLNAVGISGKDETMIDPICRVL